MTKTDIQNKAVKLSKQYFQLLLSWCTDTGKTKASLDIVSKIKGRGYIILAERLHKKSWLNEIQKYNYNEILDRSDIFLYASLHKYTNTQIDWLILDEVHHLFSDKRIELIKTIKVKHIICLTATLDAEQSSKLQELLPNIHIYSIPLEQAIKWGILPKPEIHVVPITLKNSGQTEEIKITKGFEKERVIKECNYIERFNYLKQHKHIELNIKCTQQQKYDWFCEQIDYFKDLYYTEYQHWQRFKWLNVASQRKRWLAEIKTPYALEIVHRLRREEKRYICFTGSIKQAEIIGAETNVIHSKKKGNQAIINSFNKGSISSLYAINMAQEGLNLYDIEVGVIIQLDSKSRSFTQRIGRVFRAEQTPIQYILYIKDTKDEEYYNEVIQGLEQYTV